MRRVLALLVIAASLLAACSSASDDDDNTLDDALGGNGGDLGGCAGVDVAVSSEKIDLLTDLAERFNESDA
jgi:hypothetical protein